MAKNIRRSIESTTYTVTYVDLKSEKVEKESIQLYGQVGMREVSKEFEKKHEGEKVKFLMGEKEEESVEIYYISPADFVKYGWREEKKA